jgi:2',3'-cyclic-nucleotide 2'-phosphodiesterase (5'-nucleotidase family)
MKILQNMGYTAVGLGENEAALTISEALSNFALNESRPRVLAANILDAAALFPLQLKDWVLGIETTAAAAANNLPKIGVTSVIGLKLQDKIKEPNVKFEDSTLALQRVLAEMDHAGAELRVLLYQGHINGSTKAGTPTEGVACARFFPQFNVLLCLSDTDLPPALPLEVDHPGKAARTQILSMGHKGKYVGVLGVWRTGKADPPFDFKYQLVELTPEFVTPKGQEKDNPVLMEMEEYTKTLKDKDYLSYYPQTKHVLQVLPPVPGLRKPGDKDEPTYVGSETCKK